MPDAPSAPTGPPDGTYTAVLDRIEHAEDDTELAVLVIESDGEDIGEAVVERETLPEAARAVDSVVEVTLDRGVPTEIEPRPEETADRSEAAQSRFDRLSRRREAAEDDAEAGDE